MSTTHFTRTWQGIFACASETFDSPRAAARVARTWSQSGWVIRLLPGPAPKSYCGSRRCSIITEHGHGEEF